MKGVPRIMKSKSPVACILWSVAVIGLLCVSITQCYRLLAEYLAKPKTIKMSDINVFSLENNDHWELFQLPGITVCNQNQLTVYNNYPVASWQDYATYISSIVEYLPEDIKGMWLSPRGYIEFLGPTALLHNETEHDFIIDCTYGYNLDPTRYSCKDELIIMHFPNGFLCKILGI